MPGYKTPSNKLELCPIHDGDWSFCSVKSDDQKQEFVRKTGKGETS